MNYFKKILYGGDYNPEQWPKEIWTEDMQIFKDASINSATINVFAWAKLQPSENEYNFHELDEIVSMLSKENYEIVLATSTAAMPAWLFTKYPEVARTTYEGWQNRFGSRHNFCPNSLIYQKYAKRLTEKIVERYGMLSNIACWHVNNEYNGSCYCENCEKNFRVWLKKKYRTLDNLNDAWNMDFWSHRIYSWEEIVVPNARSDGFRQHQPYFAGISLDYMRFNSDSLLNLFKMERDIIRKSGNKAPITTNFMGTYKGLDYFKWAKELDIVSWDSYPAYDTPWSDIAMSHDLMRGLKNQPFMLMEQTPSQQNYQPYNALKRPGQLRAQSYQTIAHGADSILYFQLRQSKGACEKFHGGVIEHSGRKDTRVLREVSEIGKELERISPELMGSNNAADVGIIFDWPSYWGLEFTSGPTKDLNYVDQIKHYYKQFYKKNIPVDFLSIDADLSNYKLVIAPVLYMVTEETSVKFEEYVKAGGTLVTTFMSGIVNQSDNIHLGGYPGPLKKLTGIWVEEIDALAPNTSNKVVFDDKTTYDCRLLCDLLHLEGAQSVATYDSDFYKGMPAITKNSYGKGTAYYLGSVFEEEALDKLFTQIMTENQIVPLLEMSTKLEVTCRKSENNEFYFLINFTDEMLSIPHFFVGKRDLLTDKEIIKKQMMKKYDVLIVKRYDIKRDRYSG